MDKDKEIYDALLAHVEGSTIDDLLLGDILTSLKNKKLAYELALISLDVSEGRSSVDKIFSTVENFDKTTEAENIEFVSGDLNELYTDAVTTQGLRWRSNTLNRMLGSLRSGDFGFVFARPETGKTTFLASEVTFFATQVDRPILWFNR